MTRIVPAAATITLAILLAPALRHTLADDIDTLAKARALIDQLQRENAALRAQIAMLQKELADARQPPPPTQTIDQPAAPQLASPAKSPSIKPFSSALDLLNTLPPDLQLKPSQTWTTDTWPLVRKWLAGSAVTFPFDSREIIESIKVAPNSSERRRDPNASPFVITVTFVPREIRYQGQLFQHRLGTATIYANDDLARRAGVVKPGVPVRVTGKIHTVSMDSLVFNSPEHLFRNITIYLSERQIHLPQLTP